MAPQENGYHIRDFWLESEQKNGLQHLNSSFPQEFARIAVWQVISGHPAWFIIFEHCSVVNRQIAREGKKLDLGNRLKDSWFSLNPGQIKEIEKSKTSSPNPSNQIRPDTKIMFPVPESLAFFLILSSKMIQPGARGPLL
jgi:hypothetical protein